MIRPFTYFPAESAKPRLWEKHVACFAPCLAGGRNIVPDLSLSRFNFTSTGTAMSMIASPIGTAMSYTGNAAHIQAVAAWGLPTKVGNNAIEDVVFLQAFFKFTHSGSAKESTIFWSDNPTVGSPNYYGYRLYVDNNTDKLRLMIANNDDNATTLPTWYTSAALTAGRWYHAIVGWWPNNASIVGGPWSYNSVFWIDGLPQDPTVTNSSPSGVEEYCAHLSTLNARVGATLGSTAPDVQVALINVWNRGLLDGEVAQLFADPLAMFRRRRVVAARLPGRVTRNTRQTMNVRPGVGFQTMRRST